MRRALTSATLSALAALTALAAPARADAPPTEHRDPYSPYERSTIERAVKKTHDTVEPSPEGKIFEGVDVVSLDVFEDRDPLPSFLTPIANWFHVTTRKYVIEREVLLTRGERYSQALVDETARNLRGLTSQISLALVVPVRGGAPDRVRLLIITKDVWSLRLNSNYTFADGRLQYLLLEPSEQNLLGSHQQILGRFVMDPATFTAGGSYIIPRVAGSRVNASVTASAIINRTTGAAEGSTGTLSYGQPLYSTRARWAWGAAVSWDYEVTRRFIAGLPTVFDPSSSTCVYGGGASPPSSQRCEYRRDIMSGNYTLTRSFGSAIKHDVTVSFSASRREFRHGALSTFTKDQQTAFEQALMPVSDTQIGPSFTYRTYSTRYFDVLDLDSLGLTESYQRGHDVTVQISPVAKALHSSRNFVEVYASAAYTLPIGDGLVRAAVASDTELTTTGVPDGSFSASLRVASPRFGHGRVVFDARVMDRYQNYLNNKNTLGGDGRLRGYPAAMFIGKDYVVANLEYRSDPIEIAAVQFGFTVFTDAGDAFDGFSNIHLKQSAGMGLRMVFPQLQRSAMRVDLGFPLTPNVLPASQFGGNVVVTFGQAF